MCYCLGGDGGEGLDHTALPLVEVARLYLSVRIFTGSVVSPSLTPSSTKSVHRPISSSY